MPLSITETYADTWANQNKPDKNYGTDRELRVRSTATGNGRRSYLRPNLPFWVLGSLVVSGKLHLTASTNWSGEHTLTVRRITSSWAENKLTWNRAPSVTDTNMGTVTVEDLLAGDPIEIDITAMLADVAAGAAWYGLRIDVDSDVGGTRLYSSDALISARRPRIEVDWRLPLEAPIPLAPVGGGAVSIASPTLLWQANAIEQAYSRVQIGTTSNFGTVVYDSDKVANTETEWSLDGEHTLTASAVRYWRVKVWDDAGQESPWSDPQEFTFEPLGTLTINSPAPDPDNDGWGIVTETTPPLSATLTGATVRDWQIVVYRRDPSRVNRAVWSSGWVEGAPISATVDQGLIISGVPYFVQFFVRDTVDRAATPGTPAMYTATLPFRYVRSDEVDPVESLNVTVEGPKAGLEWTRTTTPDEFCIRIDGVERIYLDPEDVRVDSTSYYFALWHLRPGLEQEVEVEAVVNGEHSDGNPVEAVRVETDAVWLVDPVDGLAVAFKGDGGEGLETEIREVAETHEPMNSPKPVRITDALGGYVGSYSGMILRRTGGGVGEARDRFLALKARFRELRLIAGDLNIPVRLEEVSTTPTAIPGHQAHVASFSFFQTGEFDLLYGDAGDLFLSDDLYLDDDLYL